MVSLDPGYSIFTNEPIAVALKKSIPVTLELATLAMILGLVVAVPIGVLSATRQDTPSDYAGRVVAVSGLSLPDFWLATLVITFAAIWFHWIPPLGYASFWDVAAARTCSSSCCRRPCSASGSRPPPCA